MVLLNSVKPTIAGWDFIASCHEISIPYGKGFLHAGRIEAFRVGELKKYRIHRKHIADDGVICNELVRPAVLDGQLI